MSKVIILAFALIVAGCASTPSTPEETKAVLAKIQSQQVAVKYALVRKQINFSEVLYRVLWLETKTSTKDFSGVWSPDEELSEYATESLVRQGFKARSVYSVVGNRSTIDNYNDALLSAVRADAQIENPKMKGAKILPRPYYFVELDAADGSKKFYDELKTKGFGYLLEFTAMDVYGSALGYGMIFVESLPNMRVVDLSSGKVVWSIQLAHKEMYQLGGDLGALEANQMNKTKEGLRAGMGKIDFTGAITPR